MHSFSLSTPTSRGDTQLPLPRCRLHTEGITNDNSIVYNFYFLAAEWTLHAKIDSYRFLPYLNNLCCVFQIGIEIDDRCHGTHLRSNCFPTAWTSRWRFRLLPTPNRTIKRLHKTHSYPVPPVSDVTETEGCHLWPGIYLQERKCKRSWNVASRRPQSKVCLSWFIGTEVAKVVMLILLIHTSTNLYTDFASV